MKLSIIGIPEKRPTLMTRPFEPKTPKKQRKMNPSTGAKLASANKHSEEDSSSSSDSDSDHSNHSMLDVTSRPSNAPASRSSF